MNDKTLVERLREVNLDCGQHTDCQLANVVGVDCTSATCAKCGMDTAHALADAIECEYLPRPRFEDGELVNIGDQFEFDGESFHIRDLHVGLDEKTYIVAREKDGLFDMEPGERVKRPELEVEDRVR